MCCERLLNYPLSGKRKQEEIQLAKACACGPDTSEDEAGELLGPRSSRAKEATELDSVSNIKQSRKIQNRQKNKPTNKQYTA